MAQKDIEIVQGSTFEWLILVKDVNGLPLDMGGYTAPPRGDVRKKYSDASPAISFTITVMTGPEVVAAVAAQTIHLSTAEEADLEPVASGSCYLFVTLSAASTEYNTLPKGGYVYDIEIEDNNGFVFKPFTGSAVVTPEATHD